MTNKDGLPLFQDVLTYIYYDGALSGAARSDFAELKFVWFTAVAVRLWPDLRIYSLATIDGASYQTLRRLLDRDVKLGSTDVERSSSEETATSSQIDNVVSKFPPPTWFCLSLDNLDSVSIFRKLPEAYACEINQMMHSEDMPFDSQLYEKWLQRIVDFGYEEEPIG